MKSVEIMKRNRPNEGNFFIHHIQSLPGDTLLMGATSKPWKKVKDVIKIDLKYLGYCEL
jgi:hypothetical protein